MSKIISQIIRPISRDLIERELTPERFVRQTNKGGHEIYDFAADESPILMQEVGRLREESFRLAGGGSGNSVDIDEFDTGAMAYRQLIVWSPQDKEILGGYRYVVCSQLPQNQEGTKHLATAHMFRFSDEFVRDYFPRMIELGRSFVHPSYQSSRGGAKSLFALDNLWDGLGAIAIDNPGVEYFFGKVTMYPGYSQAARDLIYGLLRKYFGASGELVNAYKPVPYNLSEAECDAIYTSGNFQSDYKTLVSRVREMGEVVPPLVNAYMTLSPTLKVFGTAINEEFSDVEETAILLNISEVHKSKSARHFDTYKNKKTK